MVCVCCISLIHSSLACASRVMPSWRRCVYHQKPKKKKYTKKTFYTRTSLCECVCTCVCAVVYTCEIAPDRASVCSLQSHIAHMCRRNAPTTTSTRPIAHTRIHYRGYYHISVGINENTIFKFVHNNAKRFSRRRVTRYFCCTKLFVVVVALAALSVEVYRNKS